MAEYKGATGAVWSHSGLNPGAERIYGWSESEALAMNIRDLMPENEREQPLATVRQQCRAGILEPQLQQRIAKDGRIAQVH
jgi:two-component system, chemotaxis family, CheB/CheR fusion protein